MTDRQTPPNTLMKAGAAKMLGVSTRTLERYVAAGRIQPLPVPLNPRYFSKTDVETLKRHGHVEVSS